MNATTIILYLFKQFSTVLLLCKNQGVTHWGITYTPGEKGTWSCLIGFTDSDMADNQDDWKSTSGMIYFLSSNPITWQSSKQKVVAMSTCEAGYIAASAGACQAVWLARLMGELLGEETSAPVMLVDNKAAISLIKNHVLHDQSKHIETMYHYTRECVEQGLIKVDFVITEDHLGDMFTKSPSRVKFEELRSRIGVQQI
jgi:hypothetical protein